MIFIIHNKKRVSYNINKNCIITINSHFIFQNFYCDALHADYSQFQKYCKVGLYGRCRRAVNCQIDRCPFSQKTGQRYISKMER